MRQLADVELQIDDSFRRRLRRVVGDLDPGQVDRLEDDGDLFVLLNELDRTVPGIALRFGLARNIMDLGLLGYTVLSCADIRQALDVIYRYHGLTSDAYSVHVESRRDRVLVTAVVRPKWRALERVIAEEFISGFWIVLSELLPDAPNRQRVDIQLSYPAPDYGKLYTELMPCTIEFGRGEISLSFPAEWGGVALETADATIAAVCRAQCDELIQAVGGAGGIADDVTRLMLSVPSSRRPRLQEVATELMMSPRTLERRLHEQGLQFRQIENETRMGLAAQYVSLGSMSGKQIASLLGYSNPSAFYRAFKAWHLQTPAEFQAASLRGDSPL